MEPTRVQVPQTPAGGSIALRVSSIPPPGGICLRCARFRQGLQMPWKRTAPGKWEPGGDSYQPSQPRGPCRGPGEEPGRLSITSPCGGEQGHTRGSALATAVHMGSELGASQTPAVSFLGAHQPQIPPHERPTSHPGLPAPPSLPFRVSGQKPQELRPETDGQPLRLPWGCRSARPRGVSSRTPGFSWPRTERSAAAPRLQGPDRTGWEGVGRPPHRDRDGPRRPRGAP